MDTVAVALFVHLSAVIAVGGAYLRNTDYTLNGIAVHHRAP